MEKDDDILREILLSSNAIKETLNLIEFYKLPDCWITGGVLRCTVWNHIHGYPANKNIKDIDIFYYAKKNIDISEIKKEINGIPLEIENQANIHNWYNKQYFIDLKPLKDTQDGLKLYSDSCSSIMIKKYCDDIKIVSLMETEDICNGIIRPATERYNYGLPSSDYIERLNKWGVKEKYPKIKILF